MAVTCPPQEPVEMTRIEENDWLYVCAVAIKTQDCVQRDLLEIIAKVTGRTLPAYPGPASPEKRGAV